MVLGTVEPLRFGGPALNAGNGIPKSPARRTGAPEGCGPGAAAHFVRSIQSRMSDPSLSTVGQGQGQPPPASGEGVAVDWAEVRRVYELSGETVASIIRRFGLSREALRRRRVGGGWATRPPAAEPGPLQGHKAVGSEAIELRLNKLVAIGVAMLEKRVAEEGMTEANARTLKELCRAEEVRMRSTTTEDGESPRDQEPRCRIRFPRRSRLARCRARSTARPTSPKTTQAAGIIASKDRKKSGHCWRTGAGLARPDQLPPSGDWTTWLMLGGRGAGKTRAGAEWVRALVLGRTGRGGRGGRADRAGRRDDRRRARRDGARRVGLLSLDWGRGARPRWIGSKRPLELPNGAIAMAFSSEDPESLRGPQFSAAWCDELAKWRHPEATWDMLQFGLRLGLRPRQMVTTTPRPLPLLMRILAEATRRRRRRARSTTRETSRRRS